MQGNDLSWFKAIRLYFIQLEKLALCECIRVTLKHNYIYNNVCLKINKLHSDPTFSSHSSHFTGNLLLCQISNGCILFTLYSHKSFIQYHTTGYGHRLQHLEPLQFIVFMWDRISLQYKTDE
jgi:hypothetical protein